MNSKPKKILSLDGGGTWALIQARALHRIFGDVDGHEVLRHFDLVAANSGGSIVAGALVANLRLSKVADLFRTRDMRLGIFSRKWPQQIRRSLSLPRYVNAEKIIGLRRAMGATVLDEKMSVWGTTALARGLPHVVITAFDYDRERAAFFRTNANSQAASRTKAAPPEATFLDAIHASSSAPVKFFDEPSRAPERAHDEATKRRYWDGAIAGFNNPILAGVIEVLANEKVAPSDLRVLSIGTGSVLAKPLTSTPRTTSLFSDVQKAATSILDDPPDAATFMAHMFLGGELPLHEHVISAGPIVRMSPIARADGKWAVSSSEYARLAAIELDAVEDNEVDAIEQLCERWLMDAVPNQPIRPAQESCADIGHDTFGAALGQLRTWLELPVASVTAAVSSGVLAENVGWSSGLASSTSTLS